MGFAIQVPSGEEIVVDQNQATVGTASSCEVRIPTGEGIHPVHMKISRMMNRWMVEAAGDWLIQVDEGVPARKGWLQPGSVIRVTPEGPQLRFAEAATKPAPVKPAVKEPSRATPTPKPQPPQGASQPQPSKPAARPKPAAPKPSEEDYVIPVDDDEDLAFALLEGKPIPPPRQVPPPPSQTPPPKTPAQKSRPNPPAVKGTPPQTSGASPKARPIPAPPGLTPPPPAQTPPRSGTTQPSQPAKSGETPEARCHYCGVGLTPLGQCPQCGRQFRRIKKTP